MSLCAGAKCEVVFTCTVHQRVSTLVCKAASCFSSLCPAFNSSLFLLLI